MCVQTTSGSPFFIGGINETLSNYYFIFNSNLSSCTSYTPEKVNARYLKLSKNLDYLMDDEINEKKRASLEKDFSNFFQGMKDYKEKNKDLDTRYLNYYMKESSIKLQYLKDLKD